MGQMFLHSNQRCPNGSGGRRFTYTYTQYFPSPGSLNRCGFTPETVLINEIDVDTAGTTDTLEFIELYDGGGGNTDLTGMALVLYDGAHNLSYAAFDLDGYQTDENGYFLLGTDKVTPMPDIIFPDGTLHDGEDAIALYLADGASFPNGTGVLILWNQLLDAVVYDTNDYDDILLMDILLKDGEPQVDEDAQGQKDIHSLQRCPVGSGGPFVTSTYVTDLPTPKGFVGTPLLMPEPPFTSSTLNRIYWAEVEDALGYIVQCSDTNDFYHILFTEETPGNVQNYLFGPLSGSTPYWYRVRAKNKCLLSKWSFPVSSIQDTIFPESQVVSPDGLTSETLFPVEWTATDPGILPSGVAWVSIFWNKEGGPFQFLGSRPNPITSIPFNTANFGGDGTYRFFSRARDVSGLQEPAPPAPDILVRVDSTPPESHVYEPFGVTTETLVLVKWQVQNPGFNPTAVREVSVFWRKQGNPYELLGKWNVGTIQTEFDAETHGGGGIYHFYSIAVDNAGNEESPPALPDTAVFVWKIQSSWLAY